MHVWPAFCSLENVSFSAARSRSASAKTTNGACPPSSSVACLPRLRAARGEHPPDGERAGEGELAHLRRAREHLADLLRVAAHEVDHAGREARRVEDLEQERGRQRRLLGGLEHDRVARRHGRRQLAGDHRAGEVPRRDAGHDAARAAAHVEPLGRGCWRRGSPPTGGGSPPRTRAGTPPPRAPRPRPRRAACRPPASAPARARPPAPARSAWARRSGAARSSGGKRRPAGEGGVRGGDGRARLGGAGGHDLAHGRPRGGVGHGRRPAPSCQLPSM